MSITKDQLINALEPYRDSNNTNPTTKFGDCIYDDGAGNHCIIGQILVDLGVELDTINVVANNPGAGDLEVWADDETAQFAEYLQQFADGTGRRDPPQPWKAAITQALIFEDMRIS